jgi:hypothetical protein
LSYLRRDCRDILLRRPFVWRNALGGNERGRVPGNDNWLPRPSDDGGSESGIDAALERMEILVTGVHLRLRHVLGIAAILLLETWWIAMKLSASIGQ